MDLSKLALALGLAESAPEGEIFAKAASVVTDGQKAKQQFEALSKDNSALVAEIEKQGFKVEGLKLSRVEPLKLDLVAKAEDDDEKKALKAALLEAEQGKAKAMLSSNKDFVKGLAAKMKMPPAMMALTEEILSVTGEMEALSLSKDGKVELKRSKDFPSKMKSFLEQLSSFSGVKFPTSGEEPKTESDAQKADREKAYKEHFSKHAEAEEAPAGAK